MLTMTRTEAIPYASMKAGMQLGLGDDPAVPRFARSRTEGHQLHPVHADRIADDLRDGTRGGQDASRDRGGTRRDGAAARRRAWTRACAAFRFSASDRTRCRRTSTARRWSPIRCATRTSSTSRACCAGATKASWKSRRARETPASILDSSRSSPMNRNGRFYGRRSFRPATIPRSIAAACDWSNAIARRVVRSSGRRGRSAAASPSRSRTGTSTTRCPNGAC